MGRRRKKKVGPAGGLEARYGATVRKRYVEVVSSLRRTHRCPQCRSEAVRRQSVGLWNCGKCGFTFTGGAYVPVTKLGVVAKRTARGLASEVATVEE